MFEFGRIKRLPPYVFAIVNKLVSEARQNGEDIIDLGMGNPDPSAPQHVIDKLCEAANNPKNHRYSASKGITQLRVAITEWYKRRYDVDLDPESEAVVSIGSKEGLSHLLLAAIQPGDVEKTWADVSALVRDYGYNPGTPVEEGIRKFVDWYKTYYSA